MIHTIRWYRNSTCLNTNNIDGLAQHCSDSRALIQYKDVILVPV